MTAHPQNVYLAADFGGSSGRVIAGWLDGGKLVMEEIHRFANRQVRLGNHLYWDFPALFEDMKEGFRRAAQQGYRVRSIGIDTWGVDFGLLDKDGNLLGNPVCYRDSRTEGMCEQFFAQTDRKAHYAQTGIQVMEINTLFQLYSMVLHDDAQLKVAEHLLFMPDLFSYFLTGVANNEYCIASTSELLDARKRNWSAETLHTAGLPERLFGPLVQPGSIRGKLKQEIAEEMGWNDVQVVAVGSHDTASAVAAVPATGKGPLAFLSSGTWSLLGVELEEPILSEEARTGQFTNEGGIDGRIRFLQNITGLWILQRLLADWKALGQEEPYDVILPAASEARISSIIPVDAPDFMNPPHMEKAIHDYCRNHGMPVPASHAETVRCVLQSLAQKYREAVSTLNSLLPEPLQQLHIIGGGSQNRLLNQLTANALQLPVIAGPVEATAMGNILIQAMALGDLDSLESIRNVVHASTSAEVYHPQSNI